MARGAKAVEDDLLNELEEAAVDGEIIDLLNEISDEDSAEAWIPTKSGDAIQGKVVSVSTVSSDYGDDVPLIELETKDGTWSVRGYGDVLGGKLKKLEPKYGETLAIKFRGTKESKNGRVYKDFGLVVKRLDGTLVKA